MNKLNILLVNNTVLPALNYGGTERVIWWLGKALHQLGHKVHYLVAKGSSCPFATVHEYKSGIPLNDQIPDTIDVVHIHFPINEPISKPYIVTIHGNGQPFEEFDINTVFISRNHAERHQASTFVYNGLDPDEYGKVDFEMKRTHFLFLGKASRKEKNLRDCKYIAQKAHEKLLVIGGNGFSLNGKVQYKGIIGGAQKNTCINASKALLFPVLWHEPFGLALIESLYFGSPVIGSPYGSLPEIITPEVGFLSNKRDDLVIAAKNHEQYDRKKCHAYVMDQFSSSVMTGNYLKLYEKVMNKEAINSKKPMSSITEKEKLLAME